MNGISQDFSHTLDISRKKMQPSQFDFLRIHQILVKKYSDLLANLLR